MNEKRSDRLMPPLMSVFRDAFDEKDAKKRLDLRDAAGERVIAARRSSYRAPITETSLRRQVAKDLVDLLNTVNLGSAEDLSDTPEVARSILNFGLPDLASRTIDENRLVDIARELERALSAFEPRLARESIRARRDDTVLAEDLRIRFLVKAELRTRPMNTIVEFVADVDLDTAKIKIDRL